MAPMAPWALALALPLTPPPVTLPPCSFCPGTPGLLASALTHQTSSPFSTCAHAVSSSWTTLAQIGTQLAPSLPVVSAPISLAMVPPTPPFINSPCSLSLPSAALLASWPCLTFFHGIYDIICTVYCLTACLCVNTSISPSQMKGPSSVCLPLCLHCLEQRLESG